MPATIYRDDDANLTLLNNKTVAIIGYGNQGRAHALNLRDSGIAVVVGQRAGSKGFAKAVEDGFTPNPIEVAVRRANIVNVLLPDEAIPAVFESQIKPFLLPTAIVMFAHGFNVLYRQITVPKENGIVLVSPNGPGHLLRTEFEAGSGIPAMFAWEPVADEHLKQMGLAYAKAIGCTRAGAVQSSIREETESDLFAEQVVLCGGLSALAQSAYETLTAAGFQPEVAYITCVQEIRNLADLLQKFGFAGTRERISTTAEYGDYTRGPRIIDLEVRQEMKRILTEIQSGQFAKEWINEYKIGAPNLTAERTVHKNHSIEEVGKFVRALMYGRPKPDDQNKE